MWAGPASSSIVPPTTIHPTLTMALFIPQRHHGIYSRRAPRGDVTGD